jgi:hypothetical protein
MVVAVQQPGKAARGAAPGAHVSKDEHVAASEKDVEFTPLTAPSAWHRDAFKPSQQ